MTTNAVRAWISEDRNYVDIEFDASIDVSAGLTSASILIAKDSSGTTSTAVTGGSMVSINDSKFVRFTITNQATFEAWADAEKKTSTLQLTAGAFTDVAGNPVGGVLHAANIRVHFIDETSLATTMTYHTAGDIIYLPPNSNIVSDITLDQPESTGEVHFYGTGSSTLLTGNMALGDASLSCTASDPLILKIESLIFNGDLAFDDANSQYLGGYMKNVIWTGNFEKGGAYYFAGLELSDSSKIFTLSQSDINFIQTNAAAANVETRWNVIGCNLRCQASSVFSSTATAIGAKISYCNIPFGQQLNIGSSTLMLDLENCFVYSIGQVDIPNITDGTGYAGVSLVNTQGYGYTSGGALNAGKEWTQTGTGDDPGEKSIGVPKGLMIGVGAFSNIPAVVIEPTAAVASTNTVTLTVPAGSFVPGDTIRLLPRNIQNAAGQTIAQNSQASTIAIA